MADAARPGQIEIAVLDDDADFLHYMEDLLNDEGCYAVQAFANPGDLLAACERRVPGIVLLDLKMGEHRGEKVLEQLQSLYPGICVIIVTGYPSLENMRATFQMRAFDYLAKPFSLAQLRQTLENAVRSHGLGRTPQDRLREHLGHRIRVLRVERRWSLKDLASASRLSVSQLSSIERGAHLPSIESLLAIAQAFDRQPSEILASIEF